MKLSKSDQRLLDGIKNREFRYGVAFDAAFAGSGHANSAGERGVVRRLLTDDVNALVLGYLISIRAKWAIFAWQREKNRWYDSMWPVCVWSAAIHDWELFNKMIAEMPAEGRQRFDNGCERLIYEKLFAILRDEFPVAHHEDMKLPYGVRKETMAFLDCLNAIGNRDGPGLCGSLAQLMTIRRRATGLYAGDRLVCLLAHGLWEIANLCDPALVSGWDTNSSLPWDSTLHSVMQPIDSSADLYSTLELNEELLAAIQLTNLRPAID